MRQQSRSEASKPQKRREDCDDDDEEGDSEEVSVLKMLLVGILVYYFCITLMRRPLMREREKDKRLWDASFVHFLLTRFGMTAFLGTLQS